MAGDLVGRRAARPQLSRRPIVRVGAVDRAEILIDRAADERVREAQAFVASFEQAAPDECVERNGRVGGVEPGQLRRRPQIGAFAQNGDRRGQLARAGRHAGQPQQDHIRHTVGCHRADLRRRRSGWCQPAGRHLAHQLRHEQRVTTGRRVTGIDEGTVGVLLQRGVQPARDRGATQRRRTQHAARRVGHELRELPASLTMRRASGNDQQDRRVLQAADEKRQKCQRRVVGALRIVDENEQRPADSDVGHQPEQAVQTRKDLGVLAPSRLGR